MLSVPLWALIVGETVRLGLSAAPALLHSKYLSLLPKAALKVVLTFLR